MTPRLIIAAFIVAALTGSTVPSAYAQTPAVQKAFEEVRTKLDDLVSAKDENLADNLALRIQAFKKVVEFSEEEAKNLRVKLLATNLESVDEETLEAWKTRVEKGLGDAETYYQEILDSLTTTTVTLDLNGVKTLARSLKEWREASFAPLSTEVEEFLLIAGQTRALEVTRSRLAKIESDVVKLERAKIRGVAQLPPLLDAARTHVGGATDAYDRAYALFVETIAPSSTSTTSDETEEVSATSTLATEEEEISPPPSLRDEIRASLEGVKQAYRTFIEMSVEVKKILK